MIILHKRKHVRSQKSHEEQLKANATADPSKPTCIHTMRCICFNVRDCTNICRCGGCGNKRSASEGKEKRRNRIGYKLVSARTQVGENELQLIEPQSKINSFQHFILESFFLFFFIVKDCKISLLVVKDFLLIVEMLQKNYDIVVEDIEGKIGNTISKRTLEKSALES